VNTERKIYFYHIYDRVDCSFTSDAESEVEICDPPFIDGWKGTVTGASLIQACKYQYGAGIFVAVDGDYFWAIEIHPESKKSVDPKWKSKARRFKITKNEAQILFTFTQKRGLLEEMKR
jgi:hypothetical protein